MLAEKAQKEIKLKERQIINPQCQTNELGNQNLASLTALQGEVRGLNWWVNQADSYLKKLKENE